MNGTHGDKTAPPPEPPEDEGRWSAMNELLRVDTTAADWAVGQPSPRRVATAPTSPSVAYTTDRETVLRSGSATVAETHLIRSTGSQSQSYTEEHWSSEITSFVAAAPPKFIQVIKAYRVLNTDTPTLVVEVASEPPAIFEWFCNDRPVKQDRRRFQARHGLNITTLTVNQPEDGVYKCTARNPAGCSTSYGYIAVNFEHHYAEWSVREEEKRERSQSVTTYNQAPRFINQVPNLTVPPGQEAVIDVEVDANPPARFSWFVNGREYREQMDGVELYYPKENRCVARFSIPTAGEYKVIASNVHGSAMSNGRIEIHQATPSKQMRPPLAPGEHMSRTVMTSSQHAGHTETEQGPVTTHQMTSVYEVNYTQRASSVPRGVRHLERHVEVATEPSLEEHRADESQMTRSQTAAITKKSAHMPRSLHKTRSEGSGSKYLPHPPRFLTKLPEIITVQPNEKLMLSVDVSAIPTADFQWNVNGFEVKAGKNVQLLNEQNRSTLVMNPPVKQGKYNVTAINHEGRDSLATRVTQIVTEVVEETHSEIRIEIPHGPDIVESAVTVTSAHEEQWDMLDDGSNNSTTSFETVLKAREVSREENAVTPIIEEPSSEVTVQGSADRTTQSVEVVTSYSKIAMGSKIVEDMPKRPVFTQPPIHHIHVQKGEQLILDSMVESTPPSNFCWFVNNFEVKSGEYIRIEQPAPNHSRAVFLAPAPGQYKVIATNQLGQTESVTRITTEIVEEEFVEKTTITTTSTPKPVMFRLTRKSAQGRSDLPKAPRILEKLPQTLRLVDGQPLNLKVTVDAIPPAVFTWLLNNFEIKNSQSSQIHSSENTSELRVAKATAGKYEVIARNDRGQDSSACKVVLEYADVKPQVSQKQPPLFIQSLPESVTMSGEEVRLVVTVSGLSPIHFRWFMNQSQLTPDPASGIDIVIEGNRSILILKKELIQEHVNITIQAENIHGNAVSETKLIPSEKPAESMTTVEPPPMFMKLLEDVDVEEGGEIVLEVLVDEGSEPCNFQWSLEDQILLNGVNDVEILSTTHASGVYIPKLEFLGTKQITVIAQNSKGTSVSTALLTVCGREEPFEMVPPDIPEECAPKILEPLHSTSFLDGQPMVLRARIHANPSAAVVWSKDDVDVEEWVINKDVTTQVLPGGICELLNPECYPEDSGLYKCHATNPHGTAETSAYISVEGISYTKDREEASMSESCASMLEAASESIILPPKFIENLFAETDGVKELNYIRLVCRVISRATTTYTWWKDDNEVLSSEKYEIYQFDDGTQILTIHAPGERDNGVYTCKAESEHGLGSSSCEVIVPVESSPESIVMVEEMDAKPVEEEPEMVEEEQTVDFEVCFDVGQQTMESTETKEDVTELKKEEEEFKLLVKVADSVASALVANVFVDAVREAARKIAEESSEEEDFDSATDGGSVPRFDTCVEEYVAVEGSTTRISTNVSGYPTPFVEWYFKDEKLKISESLSMSYGQGIASLNIQKVTKDHDGTYYCHATNIHGTTVLSTKLNVVPKPSAMDVRHTMSSYKKLEADEKVDTNVFAHSVESNLGLEANIIEKLYETNEVTVVVDDDVAQKIAESPIEKATAKIIVPEESRPVEIEPIRVQQISQKEEEPIQQRSQTPQKAVKKEKTPVKEPRVDPTLQKIAEMFAESFAECVMDQVNNIYLTSPAHQESTESQLIVTPVSLEREVEAGRRSVTMPYEEKLRVIEDRLQAAASPELTQEEAVNMVMNTVIQMKDQHVSDHVTTIDVRQPDSRFDHAVTVVEPEVLQLGLKLTAPTATQLKFIDIDTILQKPGTSSDADFLLSAPSKRHANAEHRIVVLEGVSQNFQDAMTWSLKKVKRLASDGEASTNAQIEVVRQTNSTAQASTTVVDAAKIIPDLLQCAAAASKLKLENVTVSLVRQGDSSHQQLVIEYESQVEDEADMNLAHIQYERQNESKSEKWSRRSRFSDQDDLGVVAVFVEVDAVCPDQSVEIVATVNAPLEAKAESQDRSAEDLLEVSQSVTESSVGLQPPKFFRKLVDSTSVVGNPAQFKCMVSGTPTPTIVWSVDGDVIESNNEYELVYEDGVSILRINSCLIEDEGEYSCEAHNDAGTVTTKCFLRVLDQRPEEPVPSEEFAAPREAAADVEPQVLLVELPEVSNSDSYAFYKYFETASIAVKITDTLQEEYEEASFAPTPDELRKQSVSEASATSKTDISFMNTRKNSWAVAATRRLPGQPSFESTILDLEVQKHKQPRLESTSPDLEAEKPQQVVSSTEELWDDESFSNPFGNTEPTKKVENEEKLYEPRTPLLPQKLSYKGQEIAVRVNEMSLKETTVTQDGAIKMKEKTCKETELHFGAPLKEKKIPTTERTKTHEGSLPPMMNIEEYSREPRRVKTTQSSTDVLERGELSPRTLKERERFDFAQVYTKLEHQRNRELKKSPSAGNVAKPIEDAILAIEQMLRESMIQPKMDKKQDAEVKAESEIVEIAAADIEFTKPEEDKHVLLKKTITTEIGLPVTKDASSSPIEPPITETNSATKEDKHIVKEKKQETTLLDVESSVLKTESLPLTEELITESEFAALEKSESAPPERKQPPKDFADKIRELERIARKVEAELSSLSQNVDSELTGDEKEIEQAILKMSDQLLLHTPVTKAQAEASEELMRTTLADMILNPTRTAEEEIELLKRPIRLLRDQITDIEMSLMEDVEVEQINDTPISPSTDTPTTVLTPLRQRVPSVELMRMTPLTSNIKDQLTSLEELITDHLDSDEEAETPTKEKTDLKHKKKRELHKIFTQINEEINTIKKFCSKKLTKRGSDAVENVLQKVRAHVTSIVNVITLAKKKDSSINNCIQLDVAFGKTEQDEKVKGIMVFKRQSIMESSTTQSTQISTILTSAGSESDETWKFSTELKTSASEAKCSGESTPILQSINEPSEIVEPQTSQFLEPVAPPRRSRMPSGDTPAPVAPPRKKRTPSADPSPVPLERESRPSPEDKIQEKPVAPPRTKRRTASLDARKQYELVKDKFFTLPHFSKTKKAAKEYLTRSEDEQPVTEQAQSLSDWDYAPPVPPHQEAPLPNPPTKPRRSFTGNALDILKHFNLSNPFAKKEKHSDEDAEPLVPYTQLQDEEERSEMDLLEELRSMSTSEHAPTKREPIEDQDTELRLEELNTPVPPLILDTKPKELPEETVTVVTLLTQGVSMNSAEIVVPVLLLIEDEESQACSEISEKEPKIEIIDEIDAQLALTTSAYGFAAEANMKTENQLPVCHRMTVDYLVPADDTNSVQMLCEESDYATDTENSCMVKGTVQFFNRNSPLDQKQRLSWLGNPKRQSYLSDHLVEMADENIEDVELDVVLQQVDGIDDQSDETSFAFNEVIVYESDLDSRSEVLEHPQMLTSHPPLGTQLSTILEVSTETVKTRSDPSIQPRPSSETSNIVMEEGLLSQMASSVGTHKTDDTDRNLSSRLALRETDILSDESVATEIDKREPVEITTRFELRRHSDRRKVIAVVYQDMRYCLGAVIAADNSFDVEINQEPENCGLVIKVIEDQVDFTSLTVIVNGRDETEDSIARDIPRQIFDDFTETSSFDEYEPEEGNEKAGITVSIVARSLYDGIYASLEEIPWGEVKMTIQESVMTQSLDNSVHFNVTVSESTADEKRSLRSQHSFKESQNSISEMENTISSAGTPNIPSYIIKLGSTATITCELNNYLPPNSDIHWYKGKKPLDIDPGRIDRISHDLLEVLVINSVDLDDNALYSLKVNEDIFPVAYLIIDDEPEIELQQPTIMTPPQTQFVMDGQPTELSVQVNCDPSFVHWLKDKKSLETDPRISSSFSEDGWSRLTFSTTNLTDQGTYLAVLGDHAVSVTLVVEERIDEREVNVVASGTESDNDDIQEYLVPPGSTATIACELDETELQKSLVWLKNGSPIKFSGVDDKIEHVINGLKHYLVIHDTANADTGLYSVRISNTEFRVAHLSINDMASPNQGLKRKRISSSSLHNS